MIDSFQSLSLGFLGKNDSVPVRRKLAAFCVINLIQTQRLVGASTLERTITIIAQSLKKARTRQRKGGRVLSYVGLLS